MSKETTAWLNSNVLVGYTAKRGTAWHYRADEQAAEPNHYPDAIPVEDVRRRLFHWQPVEATMTARYTLMDESGVEAIEIPDQERKVIVRPDTRQILGVFKNGYTVHGYDEWLIDNVETILDADVKIGSAGLLKGGAVGWVQVEMADTMEAAGVEFRPFLTAATSLDGSLATTYISGAQVVVCDNTLQLAQATADRRYRVKHSSGSLGRLSDVRDSLGLILSTGQEFAAEIEKLNREVVTEQRWKDFRTAYTAPSTDTKAAKTIAAEKSAKLNRLWRSDSRVAPWAGTAYGVLAAVNTYQHHEARTTGRSKAERNAEATLRSKWAQLGDETLRLLATV